MKRALVFGAAGVGLNVKKELEAQGIMVAAFSDNDIQKWNSCLDEVLIIPPADIKINEYDVFAIGVFKHVDEIRKQLIAMGVRPEQIIVPILPNLVFYNDRIPFLNEEYSKYILMVIGGPEEYQSEIHNLKRSVTIKRIDFNNNFWAFQYFIEDILITDENIKGELFWKKKDITDFRRLCVDFYIMENEEIADRLEQKLISLMLMPIRLSRGLYEVVQNKNTELFWKNRLPRALASDFIMRLEKLKEKLIRYNIPVKETCIVSGAVLEAYGLRETKKNDDLDIIMTDKYRDLYGKGLVIISDEIEMHPQNELLGMDMEGKNELTDEEIVRNEKNYFWLRGIKFLTLELLYRQRKTMHDSKELTRMNYYYGYRKYLETHTQ